MTQIFGSDGRMIPVTVLKAGPCMVIDKKDKSAVTAVQLGFAKISEKKKNKPYAGHFLARKLPVHRYLKEFRTAHVADYAYGDVLKARFFETGDRVDIFGISKGKGFQGVMKRHGFKGGRASHGNSLSHRVPGSIGQRTWPGRVIKNKKMPGQMGGEQVTIQNLEVVGVEENILLVKGAVPGANHTIVTIMPQGGLFEKRFIADKKSQQKTGDQAVVPAKDDLKIEDKKE